MKELYKYCLGDHKRINNNLRRGKISKMVERLDKEILSLPKKEKVYFRGQSKDYDDLIPNVGKEIVFNSYLSVTTTYSVANAFCGNTNNSILIMIKSRSARDIREYNLLNEDEYLIPRNSKFRILNYIPSMRTIFLEEVE